MGWGSLEDTAQNENGETERNGIAPMLHRIRENGLFAVKTQSNRHFGWLFIHQTPFPYPSYLRWMGDMALKKELQFECSEEVAGDCTGIIGRFSCLVLHSTQNTLDLSPNLD